jgi:hypothetical protein
MILEVCFDIYKEAGICCSLIGAVSSVFCMDCHYMMERVIRKNRSMQEAYRLPLEVLIVF